MAQPLESTLGEREPHSAVLTPGLHAAHVELASDKSFRIRSVNGQRILARLGDGVERALVEQCMRSNQLVVVTATETDVLIVGALQTQCAFHREPDGTLLIESERIELRAERELRLKSGASALKLAEDGKVRINGHRMVVDVDTNVRVLSALVELP
jgi:hypothetical protein